MNPIRTFQISSVLSGMLSFVLAIVGMVLLAAQFSRQVPLQTHKGVLVFLALTVFILASTISVSVIRRTQAYLKTKSTQFNTIYLVLVVALLGVVLFFRH